MEHSINISKYSPLAGSSYITLPNELDHLRKRLINIQMIDGNECCQWCLVKYLNPPDHHPARITKDDIDLSKRLDFKDIKFPVKTRDIHIHKIEKNNFIRSSVFGYENKEKHPIYVSKKCCEGRHVDLLFIGEKCKKNYNLFKDFNTFMYEHTLHCRKKHFSSYCLDTFGTE